MMGSNNKLSVPTSAAHNLKKFSLKIVEKPRLLISILLEMLTKLKITVLLTKINISSCIE